MSLNCIIRKISRGKNYEFFPYVAEINREIPRSVTGKSPGHQHRQQSSVGREKNREICQLSREKLREVRQLVKGQ